MYKLMAIGELFVKLLVALTYHPYVLPQCKYTIFFCYPKNHCNCCLETLSHLHVRNPKFHCGWASRILYDSSLYVALACVMKAFSKMVFSSSQGGTCKMNHHLRFEVGIQAFLQ